MQDSWNHAHQYRQPLEIETLIRKTGVFFIGKITSPTDRSPLHQHIDDCISLQTHKFHLGYVLFVGKWFPAKKKSHPLDFVLKWPTSVCSPQLVRGGDFEYIQHFDFLMMDEIYSKRTRTSISVLLRFMITSWLLNFLALFTGLHILFWLRFRTWLLIGRSVSWNVAWNNLNKYEDCELLQI